MFLNFIKSSLRNLIKYKGFSLINISGLSIGLAVSILGFLFVFHELSYDNFHKNSDNIYRISVDALIGNTEIYQTFTSAPMTQALYNEFPEIDKITRIRDQSNVEYIIDGNKYMEDQEFMVDSSFFEIFTFSVKKGQKEKLLYEPYTAVITESTARKYFGGQDPINKIIRRDSLNFKVISVIEDIPENSHFDFNIAFALTSFEGIYNNPAWFQNIFRTYILTHKNVDAKQIQDRLPDYTDKYLYGGKYKERTANGNHWVLYLQALKSIHLDSHIRGEFKANGKREYVQIFLIISIFILLIACVNFINLSTAKSATRAKEVGIRKVVGSSRGALFRQFFGESIIISYISLIFALIIVELTLIFIPDLMGVNLTVPYITSPFTIPSLILLGIVVGLISGIYPAIILSSYEPLVVIKNKMASAKGSGWFRSGLVVLQFSISVGLIVGTFIITKQINLLQNVSLGFDKEHVVTIENSRILKNNIDPFLNDLKQLSFVESASNCNDLPGTKLANIGFGAENIENSFTLNLILTDVDLEKVLKLNMIEGRFFSDEFSTDTAGIVINESAIDLFNWTKEEAIGQRLNDWSDPRNYFHVIGVVEDFYYESKHNKIQPMGFVYKSIWYRYGPGLIPIRLKPGNIEEMLQSLEQLWDEYSAEIPFSYSFLDKNYDALYDNEMMTRKLFMIFSFLAIFIACLGLLGLASFIIVQKTKEIGIRKAMGASVISICWYISRKFGKWVLVANIIAIPLSWYIMNRWLQNFEYRIDISWWIFLIVAVISLCIAVLTTLFQTIKASLANPVDALRYE
ncbi:ABC transporter permease [Bacteroidota bacterium]